MSIIPKLATSLNRRDEVPNQELAAEIIKSNDKAAVAELVENLANRNKGIRYDCIKVLYEVGYVEPDLIAPFLASFVDLLTSKDNRLQWGAMSALACIASVRKAEAFAALRRIVAAADAGSVITRDNCVRVLITLCSDDDYVAGVFPELIKQLAVCPTNQLPMYAEFAVPIITPKTRDAFVRILASRLDEIEKEPKRKRVEKVIKMVTK
jgi:HEAT repeat protein